MKYIIKITKIIIILMVIAIISYFTTKIILRVYNDNIEKNLNINLNGEDKITINYGEEYKEMGANAFYKKNDLTNKIKINSNLDIEKVGTYTNEYIIEYKKHMKKVKREITIIDDVVPEIKLNGKAEITLYENNKYTEEGANAIDNYDGDISENIIIDGNVDVSKVGEYTLTYTVKDSNNNESNITRKVKVIKRPVVVSEQKVAVLNYHFFYEDWSENCHESICENMSKFRQHLQYLNDNGFKTLTMKEFVAWMYNEKEIPKKSVLITIDDGAHGTGKHNGNHLIPALEKYNINATLFLITGWWGIKNYQSERLEVESHTNNLHFNGTCGYGSKVNCVSHDELLNDLKESIKVTNSTLAFCFPYYEYSEESIKTVKEAGFKVAFTGGNRKASRKDNKYKIPRYVIFDSTTMSEFKNMVN